MKYRTRAWHTKAKGFTLIELIMYIIIVGVGLVGVLSTFQVATAHSGDPMLRKQALTVAEMMLEQILSRRYQNDLFDPNNTGNTFGCTPATPTPCRVNTVADLPNYNDVSDYADWSQSGVYQQDGSLNPALGTTYTVAVSVTPIVLNGVATKRVTVTVSGHSFETLSLTGYRASYED
ncbi:MAG: type II secretion system protein [Sterolibacterium sp.]|jgi:MSHA pilin protein MshD|nr:type II secretion system protein [Sterolibacterium sp.]